MQKWTSSIEGIEELAINEWSDVLSGITGDQVKHGLNEWKEDWPPTAHQFRSACIGEQKDWKHKGQAYQLIDKSHMLENTASHETARSAIHRMREMLRGATIDR